jgi:hypothetical protein
MSRWLPETREQELSDLAESVVDCHGKLIEPLAIARAKGLTASFNDYGTGFDGMLEARGGRFHIYCNLRGLDGRDAPRARFTLAHELGHFFIDEHRQALLSGRVPAHKSICEYRSERLVEAEADAFASSLLMPWSRFRPAAAKGKRGVHAVLELAHHFRTSVTATALRYVRADLFPCVLVMWSRDGYAWKWVSRSAYVAGLRKTIESVDRLPRDSPTSRALGGATGVQEAGTTKSAWFPFVSSSSDLNAIYREQAVGLGRFGALSLVFPDL